jgi:hypothetical protein
MHSSAVRTGARPVDGAGPYRLSGAVRATTGTCNARTNPAHADAHWCGVPSVGVVAHSPVRHSYAGKSTRGSSQVLVLASTPMHRRYDMSELDVFIVEQI